MYTKGFWEDPERNLRVNFPWEQKVPRISALMVAEPVAAPGSRTKTAGYSVQRVRAPPRRELASRRPGGPSWKPLKRQPHRMALNRRCRAQFSHEHHRWPERALGRCKQGTLVVAGCFAIALKGSSGQWRAARSLDAALHPSNPAGDRIFCEVELQRALCKLQVHARRAFWSSNRILGASSATHKTDERS